MMIFYDHPILMQKFPTLMLMILDPMLSPLIFYDHPTNISSPGPKPKLTALPANEGAVVDFLWRGRVC